MFILCKKSRFWTKKCKFRQEGVRLTENGLQSILQMTLARKVGRQGICPETKKTFRQIVQVSNLFPLIFLIKISLDFSNQWKIFTIEIQRKLYYLLKQFVQRVFFLFRTIQVPPFWRASYIYHGHIIVDPQKCSKSGTPPSKNIKNIYSNGTIPEHHYVFFLRTFGQI